MKGFTMRLLLGLSAGTLLSFLGGSALAASPTAVLDVGSFSSAMIAPGADAKAIDTAARVVLAQRAPSTNALSFGPSRTASLRDGRRIVKLPQMHAGLPVMNRSATVTFGPDGVANIVAAKLADGLPSDVTPSVDAVTAAAAATQRAGVVADPKSAQLVIWPSGDGDRLAWHFYTPSFGLPYAPVTVVDAKMGGVIAHYNAAVSLHQAEVFPSNPVKSPQLTSVTLPLPDGATMLTDELVTAKNCVDTKMTKQLMIPGVPIPLNIHVCELQQKAIADAVSLDFGDKPAADTAPEDAFAELHIYHHTRAAYDYFRAFDPSFKVQDGPIDAVANLMLPAGIMEGDIAKAGDPNVPFEPFQNAFFAPASPGGGFSLQSIFGITGAAMMFGQGPNKDYAYDADVIYHEFTHAAVNATVAFVGTAHRDKYGLSMSPGAMNEGISDYFAAAITGDPDVGEYAVLDYDPSGKAIRSLAGPDACPSHIGGQVHNDASLFSAGLWDLRIKLPPASQSDLDLAVYAAMVAAPSGDLGYEDFAKLIVAEVQKAPGLGSAIATQLEAAFTSRGVLPECARILDYKGEVMQGPMAAGGGVTIWWGLSKSAASLGNNSLGYAPGIIQVRVPIPDNTESITVDFRGRTVSSQGGLGGPMGDFTPSVLVRVSEEPITFTYSPFATTPDVVKIDPESSGEDNQGFTMYSAKADIMPGAKMAYVMIVNTADADGAFTDLAFTMTQSAGVGGAGGQAGAGVGGGGGSGANPVGPVISDDSSCGCVVPGSSNAPIGFSLVSLAALGLLFGRRRRS